MLGRLQSASGLASELLASLGEVGLRPVVPARCLLLGRPFEFDAVHGALDEAETWLDDSLSLTAAAWDGWR